MEKDRLAKHLKGYVFPCRENSPFTSPLEVFPLHLVDLTCPLLLLARQLESRDQLHAVADVRLLLSSDLDSAKFSV